jgi:hypothetical protein
MKKLLSSIIILLIVISIAFPQKTKIGGKVKVSVKVNSQVSGGGGSDFASDSFTEASDVNLIDHTPNLGGPYVEHPHANYGGVNLKLDAASGKAYGSATDLLYFTATPPSADYYVQADFYHVSTIAVNIAVAGRVDTTNDTSYIARLADGTTWQMRKIVVGVATTLGTSTNQIPSIGNFGTGRLIMTGNQISFTVNGITEIGPITDNDITAAGKVGIRSTGVSSASTGMHIDNFSAR